MVRSGVGVDPESTGSQWGRGWMWVWRPVSRGFVMMRRAALGPPALELRTCAPARGYRAAPKPQGLGRELPDPAHAVGIASSRSVARCRLGAVARAFPAVSDPLCPKRSTRPVP